jgi:hypothetical protein
MMLMQGTHIAYMQAGVWCLKKQINIYLTVSRGESEVGLIARLHIAAER